MFHKAIHYTPDFKKRLIAPHLERHRCGEEQRIRFQIGVSAFLFGVIVGMGIIIYII